ncbi:MAG: hypothetical protein RIT40_2013, partial [Planctomycetota bacterium]
GLGVWQPENRPPTRAEDTRSRVRSEVRRAQDIARDYEILRFVARSY